MIRYRHDPENPDKPIIEATPEDIDSYRALIHIHLRRGFPKIEPSALEDATQLVMIVACRSVDAGVVRGRVGRGPKAILRLWLVDVAWRIGNNARRSARYFTSIIKLGAAHDAIDDHSLPDAVVNARRMLEQLERDTSRIGLRAVILLAYGWTYREVAREVGFSTSTVMKHVRQARKLLAKRERAPWQKPNQPPPRSPRTRKRQR